MIYTIGYAEHYEKQFKESEAQGKPLIKIGRTIDYNGGSVWRTREEAQSYLDGRGMHEYSVYGVLADWDRDTEGNKYHSFNNLLVNSELVKI